MARPYHLKRRAARMSRTRKKIVEAAIDLHQTKGPAATTVADIAARAGIGRVTVYRHFPDELALAQACSGLYLQRHPPPDPEPWSSEADASARLRRGLKETYAYHRETEAMMLRVLVDSADHPVMAPYHAHWDLAARVLADGWSAADRKRVVLLAALGLSLRFFTWHQLVRQRGLRDEEAIELMLGLAVGCAERT